MKIDRKLNLVIPIETEIDKVFIHSVPISRAVFELYYLVIAKTFSQIFSQGLGAIAGPRIAFLMLKQTATDMGLWADVEKGLINEIIRLTNVLMVGEKGWETVPLNTAIARDMIDPDVLADIEGELVFFTCVSVMNKKNQVTGIMETVGGLWGSEITASNCTEYLASLQISMPDGNTGAKVIPSLPTGLAT